MRRKAGLVLFSGVSVAALALALSLPRNVADTSFLPEWLRNQIRHASSQDYHNFADRRAFLGIPNFADVASNLPFLFFGLWGLLVTLRARRGSSQPGSGAFQQASESWAYAVFFLGVTLAFFGSSYYHWAPSSGALLWDRLPMTLAFMGILAATIGDRIGPRAAAALLFPLLALGVFSVYYWHITDARGVPDLRLYGVVQFYPLLAIPLLFVLFPARYTHSGYLLAAGASYVVAKLFEVFDERVLLFTGIGGHALKHVAAATAAFWVAIMLRRRAAVVRSLPARV